MATIQDNKQAALQFLKTVVEGKIDQAYQDHVDMNGRHHNVYFPAGFPALREAMKQAHAQFPHKVFEPQNVLGDGNLVAVHSRIVLKAGEPGRSVAHLFRFENGKIVEMWDLGQAIPADSPNRDGAF